MKPGRILTGPLASGKSRYLRTQWIAAAGARLVVPTATMARHMRHELARAGHVIRPSAIQTLAELTAQLCPLPELSPGALVLLVRQTLQEDASAWGPSARTRGFHQAIANTIAELDARGYSSADVSAVARLVEDPPPEPMAFLAFFSRVEAKVRDAGLALRSWRLREATQRAFREPLPRPPGLILVDGFFSLTEPEIGLINALRRHAETLIALPDWPGAGPTRQRLLQAGFLEIEDAPEQAAELLPQPAAPPMELITAGNFDAEVQEITRRVLAHHQAGLPFRDIGVVLRDEQPYASALRSAFERFGIPARFYFVESLDAQPLFRYFALLAAAARSDWEHGAALSVLRCRLSTLGGTADGDRLDFQIRDRLPSRGLEPLLLLDPRLERLRLFDSWWRSTGTPEQLRAGLDGLVREAAALRDVDPADAAELARARNLQASLQAACAAAAQVAALMAIAPGGSGTVVAPNAAVSPNATVAPNATVSTNAIAAAPAFWEEFATVASFTPVREPDERRDAVHVLDVYEARQWRLPVVFCPGLLEGRFPKNAFDDPLFPDRFRQRLIELGLPLRTLAERQQEEDFLFDLARTRAGRQFIASYPRFDRQGQPAQPSFFLSGRMPSGAAEAARLAPRPSRGTTDAASTGHLSRLDAVAATHRTWSPARLESFLQCPYQFFGRHTLKLDGVPPRPEERLDKLTQGRLMHEVLAFWQRDPLQPIEAIFERLFVRACHERNTRPGYLLEMHRLEMLRHVREFTRHFAVPGGWTVECEVPVRFTLAPGVEIRGRMDRVDVSPAGEAAVYDFKYSGGEAVRRKVRDHDEFPLVQGGLYLLGLEATGKLQPRSFHYVALRDEAKVHGWSDPGEVRALIDRSRELTLDAVERIRAGEIRVAPRDKELCTYCELRDACRVRVASAVQRAEPA